MKLDGYFEREISLYNDEDFRRHFRLCRETVEVLVQPVGNCPEVPSVQQGPGRPPTPVEKQVLISLWYLGHKDPYYEIGERLSVAPSAAFNPVHRVSMALVNNYRDELIKWPSGETLRNTTTEQFENMKGFPGVVGAIDGTHIPIKVPIENPNDYVNRKFFHSVQLQVVCDADLLCIDAFCGFPGRTHDARVL